MGHYNNCINEFEKGNVDVVITVSNAHRSPYFNMVKTNQNGFSSLVISSKEKITRRQEVPEVFDMTTVAYVAKPSFVLQNHGIFDGRVRSELKKVMPTNAMSLLESITADYINRYNM